jgi:hypothetical protein
MRIRRAILAALLFSISAGPALAGSSGDEERPRKLRKAATILLSEDHPDGVPQDPNALPFATPEWFAANLHISERSGFEFRRSFGVGDKKVLFRIKGPVTKKRLGMGFQIRF